MSTDSKLIISWVVGSNPTGSFLYWDIFTYIKLSPKAKEMSKLKINSEGLNHTVTISFEIYAQTFLLSVGPNSPNLKLIFVIVFQPIRELEFRRRLSDFLLSSKNGNLCQDCKQLSLLCETMTYFRYIHMAVMGSYWHFPAI